MKSAEDRNIASLKIKCLSESEIPAYLRIRNCMIGLGQLNEYLKVVSASYGGAVHGSVRATSDVIFYSKTEDVVLSIYSPSHPLLKIVDK